MYIRQGGEWRAIQSVKVRKGGAWRSIVQIKAYVGGAWREVGNFVQTTPTPSPTPTPGGGGGTGGGAITLTAAPSTLSKNGITSIQTSNAITATPSGGKAPYTYVWSRVSGYSSISFTAGSLASTAVTATGLTIDDPVTVVVKCRATDSLGTSADSNTVSITFTRLNSGG